jgi:putative flavoprotein involved in K+ transport
VRAFDLPLALDEPVRDVRPEGDGFAVTTDYHVYAARNVVIATGPFQQPSIPSLAATLPRSLHQLHSSEYRNPAALPDGPALVVGGGNSGVQIAAELSATRPTTLAVGSRLPRLPTEIFGRSVFEWLDRSGAMNVSVESRMGRRASRKEMLIGESPQTVAKKLGVRLVGRAVGVSGCAIVASDGTVNGARTVIWATGYRPSYPWLHAPALGPDHRPLHRRGVTSVPGLYFLGLPWQHTRGSALLGWVGRDAAYVADHMQAAHRGRYSALSDSSGLAAAARRAGRYDASSATAPSSTTTAPSVTGSLGSTP